MWWLAGKARRKIGPKPTSEQLSAAASKLRSAYQREPDEARDMASAAANAGIDFITRDANIEALVVATTRFAFDPTKPHEDTPFLVWASFADNVSPGMMDSIIRGGLLAWINSQDLPLEQRWEYAKMLLTGEDGLIVDERELASLVATHDEVPRSIRRRG